jgi:hypothetical protein
LLKEKEMNRRDVLKSLVAVPTLGALSHALTQKKPESPSHGRAPVGVLRVILNGPFALVIQKNTPDRLTLFVPPDPDRLHAFYFNNMKKPFDDGQDPKRQYHFTLGTGGLDVYEKKRAYIDQCFKDFTFHTDLWQRESYFVTVDVPVPDVVGFIPPPQPVTFKNGKKALMPLNHLLEYRMTDPDDIRITAPRMKDASPRPLRELEEEYSEHCKADRTSHEACTELRHEFSGWSEPKVSTYYFSIGIPPGKDDAALQRHALTFFNDVLLRSFPHLADKQLAYIGNSGTIGKPGQSASLQSAVWYPDAGLPLLRPVTSVMECKIGGFNVLIP